MSPGLPCLQACHVSKPAMSPGLPCLQACHVSRPAIFRLLAYSSSGITTGSLAWRNSSTSRGSVWRGSVGPGPIQPDGLVCTASQAGRTEEHTGQPSQPGWRRTGLGGMRLVPAERRVRDIFIRDLLRPKTWTCAVLGTHFMHRVTPAHSDTPSRRLGRSHRGRTYPTHTAGARAVGTSCGGLMSHQGENPMGTQAQPA